VRRGWAAGVVGIALLAGCGGDGHRAGIGGALERWAGTARAFDRQLESCGSQVYPTHDFFTACMKQGSVDYAGAAAGVRRAFEARAASSAACRRAAGTAERLLTRDTSLMAQEVAYSDQLNNAATDRLSYAGPPLPEFETQARATIDRDQASLRKLGDC
jgi:hypothetical protein